MFWYSDVSTSVFDCVPAAEQRSQPQPAIRAKVAQQHHHCQEYPHIAEEMNPLDIERAENSARVSPRQRQHVDLDHLGDVFQEVSGLGDDKHLEQCKPLVQTKDARRIDCEYR